MLTTLSQDLFRISIGDTSRPLVWNPVWPKVRQRAEWLTKGLLFNSSKRLWTGVWKLWQGTRGMLLPWLQQNRVFWSTLKYMVTCSWDYHCSAHSRIENGFGDNWFLGSQQPDDFGAWKNETCSEDDGEITWANTVPLSLKYRLENVETRKDRYFPCMYCIGRYCIGRYQQTDGKMRL